MDWKVDRQHHPKDCHLGLVGDIPVLLGDILGLLGDSPSNSLQRSRVPERLRSRCKAVAVAQGSGCRRRRAPPARPASGRAGGGQRPLGAGRYAAASEGGRLPRAGLGFLFRTPGFQPSVEKELQINKSEIKGEGVGS